MSVRGVVDIGAVLAHRARARIAHGVGDAVGSVVGARTGEAVAAVDRGQPVVLVVGVVLGDRRAALVGGGSSAVARAGLGVVDPVSAYAGQGDGNAGQGTGPRISVRTEVR